MDESCKSPQEGDGTPDILSRPVHYPQQQHLVASYGGEGSQLSERCNEELKRPWSYGGRSGGLLAPPGYYSSTQKQLDEFEEVISKMATMTRCPPPYPGNVERGCNELGVAAATDLGFSGCNELGVCNRRQVYPGCRETPVTHDPYNIGCGNEAHDVQSNDFANSQAVDNISSCGAAKFSDSAHSRMSLSAAFQNCANASHCPTDTGLYENKDHGNLGLPAATTCLPPSYHGTQQGVHVSPGRQPLNSPRPSPYPSPLTSPNPETPPPSNPPSRRSSLSRLHQQVPVSPCRIHVSAPWEPRSRPMLYNAPPASVRSIHTNSRTSFKQQLMRTQQQQEEQRLKQQEERRLKQQQQQLQYQQFSPQQQRSSAIDVIDPRSIQGNGHHSVVGDGGPSGSVQVQSLLENPTLYHVLQTRDRLERHQTPSSSHSSNGDYPAVAAQFLDTNRGQPQPSGLSRSAIESTLVAGNVCSSSMQKHKGYSVILPRSDPGMTADIHRNRPADESEFYC
ncbi:serine/threonine-protein kinase phg2-like [Hyalella azteca]|uniref:Serine/threonine-protein kinase phg2-like n=1 Tax=Hyalella azteca TaxID=294128 RepID=A0A979FJ66_HYAAZ|nr:serine/threonine-protein kinase phg2-like [Hyalella azteca]